MKFTPVWLAASLLSSLGYAAPVLDPDSNSDNIVQSRGSGEQVDTASGYWQATVYESFLPVPESDDTGTQPGANIKLEFNPKGSLTDTTAIRLVQFKYPLKPRVWSVDSGSTEPWYGGIGTGDVKTLQSLPNLVLGGLEQFVGSPLAQQGFVSSGGKPVKAAYIIDHPREPVGFPSVGESLIATYTTFAYDVDNQKWLGGVSWGYILRGAAERKPSIQLLPLKLRANVAPLSDEAHAAAEWKKIAGKTPVPNFP